MAVDKGISLGQVKAELQACASDLRRFGWEISAIDEDNQTFSVKMSSRIDSEIYIVQFRFDDYREIPLYIEFIDPQTNQPGTKNAYPSSTDSFFHTNPVICHPCSRKAYKVFGGPHEDWSLTGWESNPKTGALKNIRAISTAIHTRINDSSIYKGRMK